MAITALTVALVNAQREFAFRKRPSKFIEPLYVLLALNGHAEKRNRGTADMAIALRNVR